MAENNYEAVFEHGRRRFLALDPVRVAANAGLALSADGQYLRLPYFHTEYLIATATGDVRSAADPAAAVDVNTRMILMHHLIGAGEDAHLAGEWVPYRAVKNCSIFTPTFEKWALKPLAAGFAGREELLAPAALALGGEVLSKNRVLLHAFPLLPVIVAFWDGDDEVAATANILFDAAVHTVIHEEDVCSIARDGVQYLLAAAGIGAVTSNSTEIGQKSMT